MCNGSNHSESGIHMQVAQKLKVNSISLQDKNLELALTLYADHCIYILNVKNSDFWVQFFSSNDKLEHKNVLFTQSSYHAYCINLTYLMNILIPLRKPYIKCLHFPWEKTKENLVKS